MDYMKKLMKYARSGIREYWIVDPLKKKTVIYTGKKARHGMAKTIIIPNRRNTKIRLLYDFIVQGCFTVVLFKVIPKWISG